MMALVADKLEAAEARVQQLEALRQAAAQRLSGGDPGPLASELPPCREEVQALAQSLEAQLAALHEEIQVGGGEEGGGGGIEPMRGEAGKGGGGRGSWCSCWARGASTT